MASKSEDAYTTNLRAVLRIATEMKDTVAASYQPNHSSISHSTLLDSINFPSPRSLLPSLLEAGFSQDASAAVSKIYHVRAEELRQRIQQFTVTACREIAQLPAGTPASSSDQLIKTTISIFTERYLDCLEQWRKGIIQRYKPTLETGIKLVTRNSPTFNHKYVPLLEHFFRENPFPTHADKVFLAEKTNMQYRQIHIWFQNRRSRTKKEEKVSKKMQARERSTGPPNEPYERMGSCIKHLSPVSSSKATSLSGPTDVVKATQNNVLQDQSASSSPPYAFPSSYPPICEYDPFPCKSGPASFGKPEWRRIPNGKPSPPPPVSVDDLVESFARLNVRDEARFRGSSRTSKVQAHAATVAITVIPSHAPHPSLNLMARQYVQPINISPLPSVRAPTSQLKVFHHQGSTSPVTLVPSVPASGKERPMKRKIAPLPQRLPSRPSNDRRDTSSSSSSSPHLSSTDSESPSPSSGSPFSMPPSIPEFPQLFESRCRSSVGGPIYPHRLGDMVAIAPSAVS